MDEAYWILLRLGVDADDTNSRFVSGRVNKEVNRSRSSTLWANSAHQRLGADGMWYRLLLLAEVSAWQHAAHAGRIGRSDSLPALVANATVAHLRSHARNAAGAVALCGDARF